MIIMVHWGCILLNNLVKRMSMPTLWSHRPGARYYVSKQMIIDKQTFFFVSRHSSSFAASSPVVIVVYVSAVVAIAAVGNASRDRPAVMTL